MVAFSEKEVVKPEKNSVARRWFLMPSFGMGHVRSHVALRRGKGAKGSRTIRYWRESGDLAAASLD
jgi:hypothetical protein